MTISAVSLENSTLTGDDALLTEHVKEALDTRGYVYVRDVPESFDHAAFLAQLGEFLPQYDGNLIWHLRPEPDMDDVYHSGNQQKLVPHTEAYEYPGNPPRIQALWCVQPADGPGGETTIADGHRFLETLSDSELGQLRQSKPRWKSSEGLARKNIYIESEHAVLTPHEDREILRYSYNNLIVDGNEFLADFLERGKDFFDRTHDAIDIEKNGMLIWDNWRMMHSRNAFKDAGRHLCRVLMK